MKKIILIALVSTMALAQSTISYKSKSKISVTVEGDLKAHVDKRSCRNNKCNIWMNGKNISFNEKDFMTFKKNKGNYVRLNCDYDQRRNAIEHCKITSVRKWEKPEKVEISKK